MKKHLISFLSLTLLLGFFSQANGQAVRNGAERAADHNQIAKTQATIKRDRGEIAQFRGYRNGLHTAIQNRQPAVAAGQHAKLVNAMEREVMQGKAKIAGGQNDLVQSKSEVRSESREIRRDRAQGKPVQAADDRRDRRDDIRDVNDDKRDLAEVKGRHVRQKEILATFKSIKVAGNPNAMDALKAKKHLLDEFEQTMIRDMGENWEELAEDKGELREDRRETREDRRQR